MAGKPNPFAKKDDKKAPAKGAPTKGKCPKCGAAY